MDGVTSFTMLLQVFTDIMTQQTANSFRTLIVGWLLAPRRTIMGMVRASGTERHHAAFHRLFASAKWSIDQAGLKVFDLLTTGKQTVYLSGDDTLLSRRGLKVFWHRNASGSDSFQSLSAYHPPGALLGRVMCCV